MGGLIKQPKIVQAAPPPLPPPPAIEDASVAAESQAEMLRRRKGRASTILTGQAGDQSAVQTATKALLGS